MEVLLGADHAATALKKVIKASLQSRGHTVSDVSPLTPLAGDDYPDYAFAVAERVGRSAGKVFGILACDTGIGMAIAANKIPGVRAALVFNQLGARRAREHNDANILVLGADLLSPEEAVRVAEIFLTTPFSGEERHVRRLRKIAERDDG